MKNKKQIMILGGLLLLWLSTFVIGGNKEEEKIKKNSQSQKKKIKKTEDLEINFEIFLNREKMTLDIKRDLFFLAQEKVVKKPKVKKEVKLKPRKPKPVKKPQRPIVKVESDSVKIKREMNKIQFLGFYENGADINIFIQYLGQDYEFRNKGDLEIILSGKSYIINIEMIDNSNIRIQENSKNVYLNKGL